ncbi:hypothetical protein [Burkholderia sp. JP2-270]|uniref:hypothetical protein n=1 Tax=Burkholderia sp. JP2-270 TaxID=2217913 RepID=UPI0019551877
MRALLFTLAILLAPPISVHAQVGIDINLPGINIGINMPVYPRLVRVPGYPVYYAPQANGNYFFYDGLYWVYDQDNWYVSSWYNGPWEQVEPEYVPVYVLRIPVRYYRRPPRYFVGWNLDAPPRWGDHWGRDWEANRRGWDRWDRRSAPPPALLPNYQRQYSGARYPRAVEQQNAIRSENYRYQPREAITRQHFQQQGNPGDVRGRPQTPGQIRAPSEQQTPPDRQPPRQAVPRMPLTPTQPSAIQPSAPMQTPQPVQPQTQQPREQSRGDMGPGQQRNELNPRPSPREQQQNQQQQRQQEQQRQQQQQQQQQRRQPLEPQPDLRPPQSPMQQPVPSQQQPMPRAVQPPAPVSRPQPAPAEAMPPRGQPNQPRQQPPGQQQDRQATRQMPAAQPPQQTPAPQGGSQGNDGGTRPTGVASPIISSRLPRRFYSIDG